MGTRGFRVVRFRKRYYIFFNRLDSYPEILGTDIAAEIPGNAAEYQEWLVAQRKLAEEWEAVYEQFLSVRPGSEKATDLPEFMQQQSPSLLTPLNDLFIEWVYTVDLDRETFSVNNGAHFKLQKVPHIDWINSLDCGEHGDQIPLPATVPKDAITSLVADQRNELLEAQRGLAMSDPTAPVHKMIVPKDIFDIHWRQRHGPILRNFIFCLWSHDNEDQLAASLLQWSPEDLPFREFAYAILCLAAGGRNIDFIPSENLRTNDVFGYIDEGQKDNPGSFVSHLASGAHLQDSPPGSSPENTIYWLDNVLVFLTAQLYRTGAAEVEIARIVRYCQINHSGENVDAVSISVEHVILVHIRPDGNVQKSAVMPLFNIKNHVSMNVSDRYTPSFLKKLAADRNIMLESEGSDSGDGNKSNHEDEADKEKGSALSATKVKGNVCTTFYALVNLFEAAACKRMPLIKVADGVFPNEIYGQIVKHVTDMKTRQSLMEVSRTFRRLCQEDLLFAKDLILELSRDCKPPWGDPPIPKWYLKRDIVTWRHSKVNIKRVGLSRDTGNTSWRVVIGSEDGKKSLLTAEWAIEFEQV